MRAVAVVGIKEIRQQLAGLARVLKTGAFEALMPDDAADKLEWLRKGGRDFLEVNLVMIGEMAAAAAPVALKVLMGRAQPREIPLAMGNAFLNRVKKRLATGGGDVKGHMRKLKPGTIEQKGHDQIGLDTGELIADVARAEIRVLGAG